MKRYYFYSRYDSKKEPISVLRSFSRLSAAKRFAIIKQMKLKTFLSIYATSR